jgi:hypothetical protein
MPSIKGIELEMYTSAMILKVMRKFVCFVTLIFQIIEGMTKNLFNSTMSFGMVRT